MLFCVSISNHVYKYQVQSKSSPSRYLDVGDGIEVFEQVVSLDVGASQGGPQQPHPQVGEGEEIPQAFHALHAGVQVVHVLQSRSGKHGKACLHLELDVFVIFGADPTRVLLSADDPREVCRRKVTHPFWLHVEGVQAVVSVELVGLPGAPMIHGLIQHHDGGTAVFERDLHVVCELQTLVPGHGDVGQQGLWVAAPGDGLPVSDEAVAFTVLHQLRRVRQVRVRGVTLITTQVWVLL